jgi:hypothetical protein
VDGLDGYVSRYLAQLLVGAVVPLVVRVRILTADWVSALLVGLAIPLIPLFMALIGLHKRQCSERVARNARRGDPYHPPRVMPGRPRPGPHRAWPAAVDPAWTSPRWVRRLTSPRFPAPRDHP